MPLDKIIIDELLKDVQKHALGVAALAINKLSMGIDIKSSYSVGYSDGLKQAANFLNSQIEKI